MVGNRMAEGAELDNFETQARDELTKLTRQLRLMENDKNTYLKESLGALSHQSNVLNSLKHEQAELQQTLNSINQINKDQSQYAQISKLAGSYQALNQKIQRDKLISNKLEQKLENASARVEDLQFFVTQKVKQESLTPQLRHGISIAKQKLETVTRKFDSVVAENSQLRQRVNEALQDNFGINLKFCQLEEDVEKLKARNLDLVDQATLAYDQREEAVGKMITLMERNAKENKQYLLEMNELTRTNRHERKLMDFLETKNKDRLFLESTEDRKSRLDLARERFADEALEEYTENFEKLLTTPTSKLSDLGNEYAQIYTSNVKKFESVNKLEQDMESLQKTATDFRRSIKTCTLEIVEQNQTKNKLILLLLSGLEDMTNKAELAKMTLATTEVELQAVLKSASNLFQITSNKDSTNVLALLGSNDEISLENLLLYMNVIEEQIAFILDKQKNPAYANGEGTRWNDVAKLARPVSRTRSIFSAISRSSPVLSQKLVNKSSHYEVLQQDLSPVAYTTLRERLRDASATTQSNDSGDESVLSQVE